MGSPRSRPRDEKPRLGYLSRKHSQGRWVKDGEKEVGKVTALQRALEHEVHLEGILLQGERCQVYHFSTRQSWLRAALGRIQTQLQWPQSFSEITGVAVGSQSAQWRGRGAQHGNLSGHRVNEWKSRSPKPWHQTLEPGTLAPR